MEVPMQFICYSDRLISIEVEDPGTGACMVIHYRDTITDNQKTYRTTRKLSFERGGVWLLE